MAFQSVWSQVHLPEVQHVHEIRNFLQDSYPLKKNLDFFLENDQFKNYSAL